MEVKLGTPAYPGDAVAIQLMKRGDEYGDVRIQQYEPHLFRVACFVPGIYVSLPGDTPKTEPEHSSWCKTATAAISRYQKWLDYVHGIGWKDYGLP